MKSWYYKPQCFKKHTQRSSFAIQADLEKIKILKVKLKSFNQTPKTRLQTSSFLVKSYFKRLLHQALFKGFLYFLGTLFSRKTFQWLLS